MKKVLLFLLIALGVSTAMSAQTLEELKAQKAEKDSQIAALKGEANAIQAQIDALDKGWKTGAFGTIGLNLNGFDNWLQKADPNTSAITIGITGNAFANLIEDKYFWRNALNLNFGWLRFRNDDDPVTADNDFEQTADVLNLSSLFGYKVSDQWAISTLAEYRTSVLSNFNNPGYLDIGAGATWTPVTNLVVVFHPLNYNFVFADDDVTFDSSLGCKIVADYNQSLPMGIAWRSNLSAFASYSDLSNLSNWTWINGFSFTAWKGIGVGLEFGLRSNKQESYNAVLAADPTIDPETFTIDDLADEDNDFQGYWLIGITYSITK